jgi:hypothetical protein
LVKSYSWIFKKAFVGFVQLKDFKMQKGLVEESVGSVWL